MIYGFDLDCSKGGKGGVQTVQTSVPTPPVEEATAVDLGDENKTKTTGKESLKIPLAKDVGSGLKV